MATVTCGDAELYYEDVGVGPAILTNHGVNENTLYWSLPGITDRLVQAGYRVVSMDMRAHGRTVCRGPDKGYDVDTMAEDINAVADHLGLDKFHLLTHATGGMVGVHYAIKYHDRLLSLMSTDTGSATAPLPESAEVTDPGQTFERIDPRTHPLLGAMIEGQKARDPSQRVVLPRVEMADHVFLNRIHASKYPEAVYTQLECLLTLSDPAELVEFMSSFYDDPDPKIKGLRQIGCPCLVLLGEHDVLFVKPSELMAREIPDARHVVMEGLGH
ncbi:MAG: alpha/beta hydrolase, partial [Pseudomonadales bacterium]|nr:alpha/beta hydrolase [Pseudomonadales bacterium]